MIVRTPRRLHLGLIDPTGSLGRRFGSMGVALEGGYEVRVVPSERLEIVAEGEDVRTIKGTLKRMNAAFGTGMDYLIEVRRGIPRHIGLGSTTQLSMAVGTALARLSGIQVSIEELALILGRGKNGGAGIYTFAYGGFILDGGVGKSIPPLLFREDFPEEWAFLLVIPDVKSGPSEEEEASTMGSNFGDVETARKISHRVLLGLLPSLKERNIRAFGEHLRVIQRLAGRHFSNFQGGEFREDVSPIVEFLNEKTYGAGQSSWGPTLYGLILRSEFRRLYGETLDYLGEMGIKGRVEIGIPRNMGAEVKRGDEL